MGDVMNFPERIDDFIEQYSFRDDERTYTNGSKLIPVFRVKQAIEHYMPKWIPCSVAPPQQPEENPIFDNKPLELYLVSVKNADYHIRAFWNGKFFTDGWSKVDVIAWQPLPQPYQPKGE